jgi:aminoglycoside/choline kinase family phosphotransferase
MHGSVAKPDRQAPGEPDGMGNSGGHGGIEDYRDWLLAAGFELHEVRALAGDVSPRRYQRLTAADGRTVILALYPEELLAACARFARTTEILAAAAVPVPRVLAVASDRGWMLLEDLGELTLADLDQRSWSELTPYFEDAAALAARIAALPAELVRDLNPPLDEALMNRELAQTRQLFLEPRGVADATLDAALEELCRRLAADPPVPCHRDYMARNLVPRAAGRVAVLDHQDLRLGPPAYDLASLLNDTLFPPSDLEERLVAAAFPDAATRLRYHRAAAQRTLKAVGTYAAFARRGSPRHLPLIAPTLRRFLHHFGRVPEGESLAAAAALAPAWNELLE